MTEGNPIGHNYAAATCTKPSTCIHCGKTFGKATCTTAEYCSVCNITSGSALGHKYEVVVTKEAEVGVELIMIG